MTILIFTPTHEDGPDPRMMESVSRQTFTDYDHKVNWLDNPLPGRDFRNVVAQYQKARQMALDGGYEALVTLEHDMIPPSNAIQKLYDTDALVTYGVYMLRHGTPTLSAWQYINSTNMGMSLSLYPKEVRKGREQGWLEVCGVGWGCTLIRREVLERFAVRSSGGGDAGDLAFASDCVKAGIKQIARFDVPCGHILPDGTVLEVFKNGGVVSRVYALKDVNVNANGQTVTLRRDHYYTLPTEVGVELARAGYVRVTNEADTQVDDGVREQPDITAREMAINPKAATRSTRKVPRQAQG